MKNLTLSLFLFLSTITFSQATIVSVERSNNDVFCQFSTYNYKITTSHPIGQAPILAFESGTTSVNNLINLNLSPNSTTNGLGDTTIFTFTADSYSLNSNAELDTFNIQALNVLGAILDAYLVPCTVYGEFFPIITSNSLTICSNGQPFDLLDSIQPDDLTGVFEWGNEQTNIFDPQLFYDPNNMFPSINFKSINAGGCVGNSIINVNYNTPLTLITTTNPTTCGNATGSAQVDFAAGLSGNYDVYWSTGQSDLNMTGPSIISFLSSGTYYANITDLTTGCKSVNAAKVSDNDIIVTETITPQTCNSNNGEILLTVTPPSGATFTSFWSNGVTTQDMVNAYSGEYSVEIHTDNNCNFYNTYTIPNNNLKFSLDAGSPMAGSCTGASNGGANVTITGGSNNYTFDWLDKTTNISVSTTQNLNGAIPGIYTCTVTDAINGCSKAWDITIPAITDAIVNVVSVTKEDCGQSNGAIDIKEQVFGSPLVASWLWSTGETTEDLTTIAAGDYVLSFTDINGCTSYLDVNVPTVKPYQPSICLLTVDTTLTYNTIIWEKSNTPIVDGWKVYRETTIYGNFELVATIPYADDAIFIDNAASPVSRSWRYYITSFNGCEESYPSFIHKTIHTVVVDDGNGSGFNVIWDDYEGIDYSSTTLFSYTAIDGWIEYTNVSSPYHVNFADLSENYFVSFNLAQGQGCNPGKAIDHNSSRSNKSSEENVTLGGETGLTIIENEEGKIMMYPNPTSTILNVYIENSDAFEYFKIVDMNGKTIYQQAINQSYNTIPTIDFANGLYFVQIHSENNVVIEKIIKH